MTKETGQGGRKGAAAIGCGCLALVLAVCPCTLATSYGARSSHNSGITSVAERFLLHMGADRHTEAYALTTPSYRAAHTPAQFAREVRRASTVAHLTTATCRPPAEPILPSIDTALPRDQWEVSCDVDRAWTDPVTGRPYPFVGPTPPTLRVGMAFGDDHWYVGSFEGAPTSFY